MNPPAISIYVRETAEFLQQASDLSTIPGDGYVPLADLSGVSARNGDLSTLTVPNGLPISKKGIEAPNRSCWLWSPYALNPAMLRRAVEFALLEDLRQ